MRVAGKVGGANEGLDGEAAGDVAAEADLDAGVGHGLDEVEDVHGPRAGEARDGVHELLGDLFDGADGLEHLAGQGDVLLAGVRTGCDGRGAHADRGSEVWHAADDGDPRQGLLDGARLDASRHAEHERLAGDRAPKFRQHIGQDLRFDAEQHEVSHLRGLQVGRQALDAEGLGDGGRAVLLGMAGDDLTGRRPLDLEEATHHGGAHVAAADDGEPLAHACRRRGSGLDHSGEVLPPRARAGKPQRAPRPLRQLWPSAGSARSASSPAGDEATTCLRCEAGKPQRALRTLRKLCPQRALRSQRRFLLETRTYVPAVPLKSCVRLAPKTGWLSAGWNV